MGTITIISGPPCAGKSTYINTHARHGDIRIDFDALTQTLGGNKTRTDQVSYMLREVTFAASTAAINRALQLAGNCAGNVFIIDTNPTPASRLLYQQHAAQFVTLDPGREVCLDRATNAKRPPLIYDVINQWYDGKPAPPPRPTKAPATAQSTWTWRNDDD